MVGVGSGFKSARCPNLPQFPISSSKKGGFETRPYADIGARKAVIDGLGTVFATHTLSLSLSLSSR